LRGGGRPGGEDDGGEFLSQSDQRRLVGDAGGGGEGHPRAFQKIDFGV